MNIPERGDSPDDELLGAWRARRGNRGRIVFGTDKVDRLLVRWHPFEHLLVSPPGSSDFSPAISQEGISGRIYSSYVRRNRQSIAILIAAAGGLICAGAMRANEKMIHLALALFGVILFMIFDHAICTRNSVALADRSIFYLLVRQKGKSDFLLWSGIMIMSGVAQWVLQEEMGGLETLVLEYGVFYKALSRGELWRLFVGPFFHVDSLHWSMNFLSLIVIIGLAGMISRRFTVAVFLLSSAVGGCAGWLLSGFTHQDAYAGVSSGVFGLFGMCGGVACRRPSNFPFKMGMVIFWFSMLNIFVSAVVNLQSSTEGHVAGFATGFLIGAYIVCRHPGRLSHLPYFPVKAE